MKTTFVPLFALCFVSTLSAQVRNDHPQLAGHITEASNGSPIAGATVLLVPPIILGRFNFQSAKTDQYGNYRFDEVSDGTYSIHASADGFVDQDYKKDTSLGGAFVRFHSSIHIEGVDFQLQPESLIRGAVTDNSGRPVASITVAAVRQSDAVRNHPVPVSSARSDASGQFVLKKLPADVYLVCASGPAGFGDPPSATRWYREIWFGDASSSYGAVPISLKEREIRTGVRISVGDELRYRIVVRPSGPEGEPVPDRYDVTIENRNHSSMRRGDGSYVIPDIPPGHYTLVSTAWSQAQYLGQGERSFDVVDSDIMLRVQLGGLGEIAGNVQWDGAHNTDPKRALFMIESEEGAAQGVVVDDEGHFRISRVLPGKYAFKPLEVEPVALPRSVKCESKDVDTNTPLIIGDHGKVLDCKVTLVAP